MQPFSDRFAAGILRMDLRPIWDDIMDDEFTRLRRAARQTIDTDRALAGDILAPGEELPDFMPRRKQAAPAGRPARSRQGSAPARRASPAASPAGIPVPAAPRGEAARAKGEQLDEIDTGEVRECTRCALAEGRTQTVFGEGNPDADLVFVGEAPGAEEDRQGRPFVGRAGELLTRMIGAMGLTRSDIYICNVVKCRPPGNRAPAAEEAQACWDYLLRQLRIIRPRVIVTLGNPATKALLQTSTGITRLRGQWHPLPALDADLSGVKVMPTFHPAYLLRSYTEDNRRKVWSDLQAVMAELGLAKEGQ
jgi:DNA polymerase